MKLTVLVPSEDFRATAGARIRYRGLAHGLAAAGIRLSLESVGKFDPATADCDALLISKCHDARSIIAAAVLSGRGKLVGVDLFDDYFSQSDDSRLIRYREWLADLLQDCAFCLCSTERMASVVRSYNARLPTHVVNDPAREHDPYEACALADEKGVEAVRENRIRAIWFGVGDNPHFPVGLSDLFAHSWALTALARTGMAVDLTILTNRRALRIEGLEQISRLPVSLTVAEWSEEAEARALAQSLVAFLPVAAQPFSAAKSLNRALTALTHGCQVLSVGYALYKALDPFIYRNPEELLSELVDGRLRLSGDRAQDYRVKLRAFGSAEAEAKRLARFIKGLAPPRTAERGPICVVHGLSTRTEIHHLVQSVGGLSVASPFCSANLDFDISFRNLPPMMKGTVSPKSSARLVSASGGSLKRGSNNRAKLTGPLASWPLESPPLGTSGASAPVALQLATYGPTMQEIERKLREILGPVRLIIAETSRIPVSALGDR